VIIKAGSLSLFKSRSSYLAGTIVVSITPPPLS
jgi:hypothetical protein